MQRTVPLALATAAVLALPSPARAQMHALYVNVSSSGTVTAGN
jgi:hypothetical protein